jgi:DNA modification methylase
MCFTDPPYGVAYVGRTNDKLTIENDDIDEKELGEYVRNWFDSVDRVIGDGAYVLATVPAGPLFLIFAQDWKNRGWLRQILVWNKSSMVLGRSEYHYKHEPILFGWKPGSRLINEDRTRSSVWEFDRPSASRDHPTMKPIPMWEYGIMNHTVFNDLLFEPFLGSGTTMIAAQNAGRICYGFEISPNYCQVVVNRMQNLFPEIDVFVNGERYKSEPK